MKAGFISLGCAKNLIDTEVMLGIMQENGIELTANPADAVYFSCESRSV